MTQDNLNKEDLLKVNKILKKYKNRTDFRVRGGYGEAYDSELYGLEQELSELVNYYIAQNLTYLIREEVYAEFSNDIQNKSKESLTQEEKDFYNNFVYSSNRKEAEIKKVWENIFGFNTRFESDEEERYLKARDILAFGTGDVFETKLDALRSALNCKLELAQNLIETYDMERNKSFICHCYDTIDKRTATCKEKREIEEVIEKLEIDCDSSALVEIFIQQKAKHMYKKIKNLTLTSEEEITF